ncbi:MAG: hypothetical protein ACFB15_22210 [Cyclobacteriaceae bacterium]
MSEVFGEEVASATRRFVKEGDQSLLIEDQIKASDATQHITWQLMTTADVDITEDGATLTQDGKQLKLDNLSHPELTVSIISLDPPPLELDRQIDGLKRLEIRIPAHLMSEDGETIRVRLSAE